ncbi:MAG TPA: hypothetical protein VGM87_06070 [Roseomonas sp.]
MAVAFGLVLRAGAPGLSAEPQNVRVTTDSVEYCGTLAQRVAALPGGGTEPARSLAEDGLRLCDTGHVRTGVAKLRRALRAAQGIDPG